MTIQKKFPNFTTGASKTGPYTYTELPARFIVLSGTHLAYGNMYLKYLRAQEYIRKNLKISQSF